MAPSSSGTASSQPEIGQEAPGPRAGGEGTSVGPRRDLSLSLDSGPLAPKGFFYGPRQPPSNLAQYPHQVLLILEGIMQSSHPAAVPLHQNVSLLPETGCL